MDGIDGVVRKPADQWRTALRALLQQLRDGKMAGLEIVQHRGTPDIYRVQKGEIRVMVRKHAAAYDILTAERYTGRTSQDPGRVPVRISRLI